MSTKKRGKKETKQGSPTQYKVVDPISLADLGNMHTRKGEIPHQTSSFWTVNLGRGQKGKGEKTEKVKKREVTQYSFGNYLN